MSEQTPKILVITGPTATGKTSLSVLLAKEFNGEIVSADSMQIYRGMDIGTAKVTSEEKQGVPHFMLDVAEPEERFSVARYVSEAEACVRDILNRGKLPILVGGTGLYIDSLVSGRSFAGGQPSEKLRQDLIAKFDEIGGEKMIAELAEIDPERAEKLHKSDKKRIVRALEIFYTTGKTITQHDLETQSLPPRYDACTIALSFENRQDLYARIDSRVDAMMSSGLCSEVQRLIESGVPENSTAMQAIGYKEILMYLNGEIDENEAVDLIKQESRRYAKRQITWLKRNKNIHWLFWNNEPDFEFARLSSTDYLHAHGLK